MITISHSEASDVLDCQQRWQFAYGDGLRPYDVHARLRRGIAWGAAVAEYHHAAHTLDPLALGRSRLAQTLAADAAEQERAGVYDPDAHRNLADELDRILLHYASLQTPLLLEALEHDLVVPVPSRRGDRASTAYRFRSKFDGIHVDDAGRVWLVEFKLRDDLSSYEQVAIGRQIRWYAYSYQRAYGRAVAGVIVDERRAVAPRPVALLKSGGPSHDKRQLVTPEAYLEACAAAGEEPKPEALDAFRQRRWQARHVVLLRPAEVAEAGRQIASTARLVRMLAAGDLLPVRNPNPTRCPGCAFRPICNDPQDAEVIDALYERRGPKHALLTTKEAA